MEDNVLKENNDDNKEEVASVITTNLKMSIIELYQYIQKLEVRGHQNSKILNNSCDAILKIGSVLEGLEEKVMNLEGKCEK